MSHGTHGCVADAMVRPRTGGESGAVTGRGDDLRDGANGAAKESKAANGRRDGEKSERKSRSRPTDRFAVIKWRISDVFWGIDGSACERGMAGRIGELTILQQGT